MSTDNFYSLEPNIILEATEQIGQRSTGRCSALNSLENRVYDVELEDDTHVISKFYRPGRWTRMAILAEHEFLRELEAAEISVAAPITLMNKETVGEINGIFFAVFPKRPGRAPDEMSEVQLQQAGRLIARIHNVGAKHDSPARETLSVESFGNRALDFLVKGNWIPMELKSTYEDVTNKLLEKMVPLFSGVTNQRLHGDCHLGNLLSNGKEFFFLDFDDMRMGPCVQDIWLLTPGRDEITTLNREILLTAYQELREFDRSTISLIEPLRTLRILHFSGWIAKRWDDPSFKRVFPEFEGYNYWSREVETLKEQLRILETNV